jgi:predicted nucleic acid-binding protein
VIVLDASVVLDVLLGTLPSDVVESTILHRGETLYAPHLLDVEVLQVLRRYVMAGEIGEERALQALEDLRDLPLIRYRHDFLNQRVWELRHNLTAYDAVYVALAEVLQAPLITRDSRIASATGHSARVELL